MDKESILKELHRTQAIKMIEQENDPELLEFIWRLLLIRSENK